MEINGFSFTTLRNKHQVIEKTAWRHFSPSMKKTQILLDSLISIKMTSLLWVIWKSFIQISHLKNITMELQAVKRIWRFTWVPSFAEWLSNMWMIQNSTPFSRTNMKNVMFKNLNLAALNLLKEKDSKISKLAPMVEVPLLKKLLE